MTAATDPAGSDNRGGADAHPGELQLRRFRAGEFAPAQRQQIEQHTAPVVAAAPAWLPSTTSNAPSNAPSPSNVSPAGSSARPARRRRDRARCWRRPWVMPAFSLAAAAAVVLVLRSPAVERPDGAGHIDSAGHSHGFGFNQRKGATVAATLRIASADGRTQRTLPEGPASAHAQLAPGEQLRLGYDTDQPRHLIALSLDDQGVITPLYPETGVSLPIAPAAGTTYLPDSIQLTGAGQERIFLMIADGSFSMEAAVATVLAAQLKAGEQLDTAAMMSTGFARGALAPRIFTWLLDKP